MRLMRSPVLIMVMVFCLGVSIPQSAAQAQESPAETKIVVSTKPALDDKGHEIAGQYKIIATLTTAEGRFVADRTVDFSERLGFFGSRIVDLGSAITNGTGNASIIYQPAQDGDFSIAASFSGDSDFAATGTQYALAASDTVPTFPVEESALTSVGNWLAIGMALLGVAYWAVLLIVVLRTLRRIRTAPEEAPLQVVSVAS